MKIKTCLSKLLYYSMFLTSCGDINGDKKIEDSAKEMLIVKDSSKIKIPVDDPMNYSGVLIDTLVGKDKYILTRTKDSLFFENRRYPERRISQSISNAVLPRLYIRIVDINDTTKISDFVKNGAYIYIAYQDVDSRARAGLFVIEESDKVFRFVDGSNFKLNPFSLYSEAGTFYLDKSKNIVLAIQNHLTENSSLMSTYVSVYSIERGKFAYIGNYNFPGFYEQMPVDHYKITQTYNKKKLTR